MPFLPCRLRRLTVLVYAVFTLQATPFNSPCLCRFYLAGYAVSTMQAAPFIPGGFGKGISF